MAPKVIKTIRELIYWEYAKLIAEAIDGDRKNYRLVMYTFQKLRKGEMHPSAILRENKMLVEEENACAYCGATEGLEWEHIIPRVKVVIDEIDNIVWACRKCNAAKGGRDPFEWYGTERQYEIPRLVLGKFLKLAYDLHDRQGTLDSADLNGDGKLDIFDLAIVVRTE